MTAEMETPRDPVRQDKWESIQANFRDLAANNLNTKLGVLRGYFPEETADAEKLYHYLADDKLLVEGGDFTASYYLRHIAFPREAQTIEGERRADVMSDSSHRNEYLNIAEQYHGKVGENPDETMVDIFEEAFSITENLEQLKKPATYS